MLYKAEKSDMHEGVLGKLGEADTKCHCKRYEDCERHPQITDSRLSQHSGTLQKNA